MGLPCTAEDRRQDHCDLEASSLVVLLRRMADRKPCERQTTETRHSKLFSAQVERKWAFCGLLKVVCILLPLLLFITGLSSSWA